MKGKWLELSDKFDAFSQRERGLIAVASLVGLLMLASMPLEALWKQQQQQAQQLASLVQENSISVQQIDLYRQRLAQDPNEDYRNRLALLVGEEQAIDARLNEQLVDMVPADAMPGVLSRLLGGVAGVSLTGFESIAPVPVLTAAEDNPLNLYRHGIRLTLEGDYFAVVTFAGAVETMPNKLYWKRMDYRVGDYPKAQVELELYTLSINKDFISVAKHD
jgi:MSHA biogenesis protein MshJ